MRCATLNFWVQYVRKFTWSSGADPPSETTSGNRASLRDHTFALRSVPSSSSYAASAERNHALMSSSAALATSAGSEEEGLEGGGSYCERYPLSAVATAPSKIPLILAFPGLVL